MPRGVYFQAATSLAAHVPHAVADLYGPRAGGLRLHRRLSARRDCRARRRSSGACIPTKQIAVAEMRIMLEQTKALWFQAISEARANPTKEQVLRAYAAQYTVMENANALAAKAIRTCGGQAMLKSLPLERIYRDSRCGSLMLPWTAEICLDRLGRETLYEPGEKDE